jgi:glucosamine--fructose-6-phosphate aminotransferase (isomerizing)
VPEPVQPIWEIVFGQYLALFAARSHGLDPDHPDHIQKVTETL